MGSDPFSAPLFRTSGRDARAPENIAAEVGEIGGDDAAMAGKCLDLAGPHAVIERKAMHQEQRLSLATIDAVKFDATHGKRLHVISFDKRSQAGMIPSF